MIVISQPTYLPWPGYFSLIRQSDHFIFLDDVQFDSRSWQQRNKILVNGKYFYLTIPIKKKGLKSQLIKNCEIQDNKFFRNHLKTIKHNYSKAKYFDDFFFEFEKLNAHIENQKKLSDVNILIIKKILKILKIKKKITKSSDFNTQSKKTEKLINLITISKEKVYLSNTGAKKYLYEDLDKFNKKKIKVKILNFENKPYKQLNSNFVSNLSILDLLFNLGEKSLDYIDNCTSIETLSQ
tara:strand:+ start:2020 stop:2733 length:714 start_codon:yes stop_codon:yes gene_type:complete